MVAARYTALTSGGASRWNGRHQLKLEYSRIMSAAKASVQMVGNSNERYLEQSCYRAYAKVIGRHVFHLAFFCCAVDHIHSFAV